MKRVYILLREDLSPTQQIIQSAHAAQEAAWQFRRPDGMVHICLMSVPHGPALHAAHLRLKERGIDSYLFCEPDNDTGYTALATVPVADEDRQPLKKYKLWQSKETAP